MLSVCSLIFFFFQAEDGIRDYKVTGVQTCALPIFASQKVVKHRAREDEEERVGRKVVANAYVDRAQHQEAREERERQRSEEHTSNSSHLVSSYAVFCLKKTITNANCTPAMTPPLSG